jgi:hypothetical protein
MKVNHKIKRAVPAIGLSVNKGTTINAIKGEFSHMYPFLKLEFFKSAHTFNNNRRNIHDGETRLHTISVHRPVGIISFTNDMKVVDLESLFKNKYGLHVQVFRKSGNIWLETTATDEWTLKQQNDEGHSLHEDLNRDKEDLNDHDIY